MLYLCFRYEQAAARGDADALFSLGVCFHEGTGADRDEAKAMALWQQAVA